MLKLKLQYFGHLLRKLTHWKDSDAGRDWGQEEKGTAGDEMAGWHHWLNGRESEWTLGVGGQGGLAWCNLWGCKESDMTERQNWTELNWWCKYSHHDWVQTTSMRSLTTELGRNMQCFHHIVVINMISYVIAVWNFLSCLFMFSYHFYHWFFPLSYM